MCVIGVDPGLRAPAAAIVSQEGKLVAAATFTISRESRGATRLTEVYDALLAFAAPWGSFEASGIEGPSLGSTHREYDLGEGSGVLKLGLFRIAEGEEPVIIEPTRLKLFATGRGDADKEEVMEYVVRNHGAVDGTDAADAAVIALIVHGLRYKTRPATRAQAEVLFAMRTASTTPRKKVSRGTKRINM